MEATIQDITKKLNLYDDNFRKPHDTQDAQMTSSTISSLSSPVDSGVQMLDSESELTSVMSASGFGCDIVNDSELQRNTEYKFKEKYEAKEIALGDKDDEVKNTFDDFSKLELDKHETEKSLNVSPKLYNLPDEKCTEEKRLPQVYHETDKFEGEDLDKQKLVVKQENSYKNENNVPDAIREEVFKRILSDDIVNQNVPVEYKKLSSSVPNYFDRFNTQHETVSCVPNLKSQSFSDDVFEMEHPIQNTEMDLMNVSLTSYELLDYTLQNRSLAIEQENAEMHVSLSEEVNENLRLSLNSQTETVPLEPVTENIPIVENKEKQEEQIVFRRQRKKKSKSDTPKKRVSFHEDILNSTKIDDIHINHGFITHEPDVSFSFFQRGFIRKPDVVKGRYSWAAEGDAPYYEKAPNERETKSEIYENHPRYSSTSSSSTASNSSSVDEEDGDENYVKKEPSLKSKPKSSCLKKTKNYKRYIDTNIVHEEKNIKKKKSETNLLDTNIFGSLKNILNFSSSVPLAERGVPEGQEDVTVYATSHDSSSKRRSFGSLQLKNFESIELQPEPVSKVNQAKTSLKLTTSEGFYPTYPNVQQNLPANIILCDSNVYEHKGISYSYEYDKFQKTFEQQNKPKSSTVYQMILRELNFFRRKARDDQEIDGEEDFEIINQASTPIKSEDRIEEVEEPELRDTQTYTKPNLSKMASSSKMDWSDNDNISDYTEPQNPRHLSSPKRKITRNNHYSVSQSYKVPLSDRGEDNDMGRSLPTMRPANSKSSLINRFLRNVTVKKMMDMKVQSKQKSSRRIMSLFVKGVQADGTKNDEFDKQLKEEIRVGRDKLPKVHDNIDKKLIIQFKKELFRSRLEKVLRVFHVRSAYTTNGDTKPLIVILTENTFYIAGTKPNGSYCNHFVLPFTELNTILVGPNGQIIHFSNYDKDMQCIITTGCSNITGDLVGQLEIAMRRDMNRPHLPAVKQLGMRDMVNLRKAICDQTSVDKHEEYYYYSIVNIQDLATEFESTPLGPNKEGPLMFKTSESESSRWETAYFILKAGVLYMLSSASQRVPMRVFPLINGSCQGARRVFNSFRPHTFQLIIESKSLLLAAPDEYVASDWLQELVHAASGTYNNQRERNPTQACSLLMTSEHILTVREAFPFGMNTLLPQRSQPDKSSMGTKALSCASIVDLTSFRLPSAEQSWCILEFACREVHEYSGDWILYFSTNAELENFISTLEDLWHYNNDSGESFPLSTIPETDPLSKKCVDVYTSLIGSWPLDSVLLQFM